MSESIIAEGKTTNEAIENGLKILKTTKENVEIKVLEQEDKRSFFSILAPRVIKVELTLKENKKKVNKTTVEINENTLEKAKENIEKFLNEFLNSLNIKNIEKKIEIKNSIIEVTINGDDINYLIGYRGDVLNSLQTLLNNVANRNLTEKCKVILDIENYRAKREKTLQELADKVSKTVIKNKKSITLEPMVAYERKIIHSRLQDNPRIKTHSIGEEPNRRIVIELK